MQRLLSTAVLAGLLIATAAAFAVTERLKLEKAPIFGTKISPQISPTCGCARGKATILLKFRHRDTVTLTIRAANRSLVDTVLDSSPQPRGTQVFRWNGHTSEGAVAPDGTYYVEVHLSRQHRTLLLPNPIVLDTQPPELTAASPERPAFSPDGDHQADSVTVRYALTEPAFVQVFFRGHRIIRGRFHRPTGSFSWAGLVGDHRLKPGTYVLSVGSVDLAGNATPVVKRAHVRVTLRYITLASRHIAGVRPGGRVEIGVSTDARRYTWRLGARHGKAHGPLLSLPAPPTAGRYRLVVTELGHSDRATVVVK